MKVLGGPLVTQLMEDVQGGISYPRVQVSLRGAPERYSALVDTGAGISVVNGEVLLVAGWTEEQLREGPAVPLGGVGGSISGWLHQLEIALHAPGMSPINLDLECVVAMDQTDDFLLGQLGFLQAARFVQDTPGNRLELEF